MIENDVTEIQPNEKVLHIVVRKRSLDDPSTRTLVDDVNEAAAARTGVPIVLDLGRVKFAPSVALGALVRMSKGFTLDGRRLVLIGIDGRVLDAIHVTQLHTVLEIRDTLDQVTTALR
jgi:anti-anti-sigma factor